MDVHSELTNGSLPTTLFTRPAVVEVVGAGFNRPSSSRYHTLQFPRVVKIHQDCSFLDAVDFTAYQLMAEQSRAGDGLDAKGSHAFWLAKLGFDNAAEESDALSSLRASEKERQTDSYASG
jgi:DNA ligase-4